jgi:hypothetical protein
MAVKSFMIRPLGSSNVLKARVFVPGEASLLGLSFNTCSMVTTYPSGVGYSTLLANIRLSDCSELVDRDIR